MIDNSGFGESLRSKDAGVAHAARSAVRTWIVAALREREVHAESSGEDCKRAREGDRIQHCLPLLFELKEDVPRQALRVITALAGPAEVDAHAAADRWA
jgi:hypothetical protein